MTSINNSAVSHLSGALPWRSAFFAGMQQAQRAQIPQLLVARATLALERADFAALPPPRLAFVPLLLIYSIFGCWISLGCFF